MKNKKKEHISKNADKIQERFSQIQKQCEDFVRIFSLTYNITLDFSNDSVKTLDAYIMERRGGIDVPEAVQKETEYWLGIYLGECIIRNTPGGGRWQKKSDDDFMTVKLNRKAINASPITKVFKQFANGAEDSIYSFYIFLQDLIKSDKHGLIKETDKMKIEKSEHVKIHLLKIDPNAATDANNVN